ncbi:MAG: phosphoribosylamine--glycine ligase [bacterium]|nr:phosphoribosylamine--glycine ligase [bacterium]
MSFATLHAGVEIRQHRDERRTAVNASVIGGGGREHALVWKLAQSSALDRVYALPGNGGTAAMGGKVESVSVAADDIPEQVRFAREQKVDLTVVGPEGPLELGIVDAFREAGKLIFGPTQAAAGLETSKRLGKGLMQQCGVGTAVWQAFTDRDEALAYATGRLPVVVKADGTAAGKGAQVCHTVEEAVEAVDNALIHRVFGRAGECIVIEDFVHGEETSIHALVGRSGEILMLKPSRDHKTLRVLYPNGVMREAMTGGMGAYAPVPGLAPAFELFSRAQVVAPLVKGLADAGRAFTGWMYPGVKGVGIYQQVLECNVRFGDPEAQVLLTLLDEDLFSLLYALARGTQWRRPLRFRPGYAVCVVMAAEGYPLRPPHHKAPIYGLDTAMAYPDVVVFHAGTEYRNGEYFATVGRTLGVTAWGLTLEAARRRAYEVVHQIFFEGMQYPQDIASVRA